MVLSFAHAYKRMDKGVSSSRDTSNGNRMGFAMKPSSERVGTGSIRSYEAHLGSFDLQAPQPITGELGTGLLNRIARASNYSSARDLLNCVGRAATGSSQATGSLAQQILCHATGMSELDLALNHSVLPAVACLRASPKAIPSRKRRPSPQGYEDIGRYTHTAECWTPLQNPQACASCVAGDRSSFQFSTWYAADNLPGVVTCSRCGRALTALPCDPFESLPSDFTDAHFASTPTRPSVASMPVSSAYQKVAVGVLQLRPVVDPMTFARLIRFLATCNGFIPQRLDRHPLFEEGSADGIFLTSIILDEEQSDQSLLGERIAQVVKGEGGKIFASACVAAILLTTSTDAALGLFRLAAGGLTKHDINCLGHNESALLEI